VPFYELDGKTPARVVLEQIGPKTFRIVEPFRYVDARTGDSFLVPDPRWGDQPTDLASVPAVLQWVVPRYGQHTLPAILHDQLVVKDLAGDRDRADGIFRDAMGEQGVPLARRWLMWAAVSVGTIVAGRRWRMFPVAVWVLLWAAIAFRLTPPFAAWTVLVFETLDRVPWWWAAILAVAGPPVLAVLWGRRYVVGVISGYGAFLFSVPLVAIGLALGVYTVVEWVARFFDTQRRVAPGRPPPATAEVRTSNVRRDD
jgi:Protein of unknown function (DUF1353)